MTWLTSLWKWAFHEHPEAALVVLSSIGTAFVFLWRKWLKRMSERRDFYTRLGKVLDQFQPNGGSSLVDRFERIEVNIRSLRSEIACLHAGQQFGYELSGDAIFWTDAEGSVTYMSRTFTKWTGWGVDELHGMNWQQRIIAQCDRERVVSRWLSTVAQGIVFDMSYHFQSRDGELIEVHTQAFPVTSEGKVVAYQGSCRRVQRGESQ